MGSGIGVEVPGLKDSKVWRLDCELPAPEVNGGAKCRSNL